MFKIALPLQRQTVTKDVFLILDCYKYILEAY